MEFLQGFFIGSTFWFWGFILIELVVMFACIAYERSGRAFVSLIVTLVIFKYLLGISVLQYALQYPLLTLFWAACYVAIGITYAILRWDRKGAKWRRRYDRGTDDDKRHSLRYRPKAKESKNQIIIWMMYWPISGTWWLISDFVRELFVTVYHQMVTLLDRIAARHTRGIDLSVEEKRQ